MIVRWCGQDMRVPANTGEMPRSMLWLEEEDQSLKAPERRLLEAIDER